jgi:histidinol-phosphate aminotransferase
MTPSARDFFRPNIARMQGYVPGEQPREGGYIKLNTNENPYPPAPLVLERLRQACTEELRLYPDPSALSLRGKLAQVFGVAAEQVMVGNGSDELLNIIIRSFADEGQPVVYPYPTYGYYQPLIHIQNALEVAVEFPEDFSLPPDLAVPGARLTFLANPNSPSGTLLPIGQIADLARRVQGILVIDEAYVDFSEGGCLELLADHPHLIVVRTMSKSFSLAGLRIGFAFAGPELIQGMWKVKDHYNLNRLSLVAAEAALDSMDHMRQQAARLCRTRSRLSHGLRQLGFHVWDSSANFVLARRAYPPAEHLYAQLKKRRVLVRYFDQRRLRDCLRVSVGTDQEIDVLLRELADILQKDHPPPAGASAASSRQRV